MSNRLVEAFRSAGFPAKLKHSHEDGYFDISISPDDVFHVREVGGAIIWCDFTHTTSLGPIDGSQISDRLAKGME